MSQKQFIGAYIPELELSNRVIESEDRHPILILQSEIGTVNLSGSNIRQPIIVRNCDIGGIKARNMITKNNIEFRLMNSKINGEANFESSVFQRSFFNHTEFSETVDFSHTEFKEGHFHCSTFKSGIDFKWAICRDRFHISECVVEGEATFSRSKFNKDVRFRQTNFQDHTSFNHVEFGSVTFSGAEFYKKATFNGVKFNENVNFSSEEETILDEVSFVGANFYEEAMFAGVSFLSDSTFEEAVFEGDAYFSNATFESKVNFSKTSFKQSFQAVEAIFKGGFSMESADINAKAIFNNSVFQSGGDFEDCRIGELHFQDTKFESTLHMDRSNINSMLFRLKPVDKKIFISLVYAKINRGEIIHPEDEYAFFDMTRATMGNIDLLGDTIDNIFNPFQFVETTFDGFDFSYYRPELEELDWDFDSAEADYSELTEEVYSTEELAKKREVDRGQSTSISRKRGLHPDVSRPTEFLETTYQKAKIGAKEVGDTKSASEFFLKEMRHRRSRHKANFYSNAPVFTVFENIHLIREYENLLERNHNKSKSLRHLSRFCINKILDVSCGYGERLRNIVGWSILSIIFGMFFYPLDIVGGIQRNGVDKSISYSDSLSKIISSGYSPNGFIEGIASLIDVWQTSLYYSIVIFTTLGSG